MPDPTFKARMAYARSIRRGSRKHVTAEVFKASVAEAVAVVKPAAVVVATPDIEILKAWTKSLNDGAELVKK